METSIYKSVGNQVRKVRRAKGMTQEELSEILMTRQSFVSRVEQGHQQMTVEALEKIAAALGRKLRIDLI